MFAFAEVGAFNKRAAVTCSLAASLSMALVGAFSKSDYDIMFLLLIRCLVPLAVVAIAVFCLFREEIGCSNVLSHLIRGLLFLMNQAAFFYTVKHSNVLFGTLMFNMAPLYVPILAFLFYNERTAQKILIAVVIGFFGAIIAIRPQVETLFAPATITGVSSGILLAASQLILQKNVRNEANLSCMFWFYLFSTVLALAVCAIAYFANGYNVLDVSFANSMTWLVVVGISVSSLCFQYFTGKFF
ncbi:EamA family transporter [Ruegeria sp. SCPT10]|uniref:EamA family transporter n=1 Tax=Ruegeria sp. SCP10 TaxID=3141377 RepID=UPI003336F08E